MDYFNLCCLLVSIYFIGSLIFKNIKRVTWDEAFNGFLPAVWNWFSDNDTATTEVEFNGSSELAKELDNSLRQFGAHFSGFAIWDFETYSSFSLPSFQKEIVLKNANDIDKIKAALDLSCCKFFLANYSHFDTLIKVDDFSPTFIVHLLFATTPDNLEHFKDFRNLQVENAKKEAMDEVAPAIDKELEENLDCIHSFRFIKLLFVRGTFFLKGRQF